MQSVGIPEVKARIERDNPWWADPNRSIPEATYQRRVYFQSFRDLALNFDVKRAAILLGPRRVGKTVIVKQLITDAIASGVPPQNVLYASIDAPIYMGISLEQFLRFLPDKSGDEKRLVIFDEIQYLKDWEIHLKDLVDNYPVTKFVASGSAAAALKLKSQESGAGRFSEFMLPPLTFFEFLQFTKEHDNLISCPEVGKYETYDINALNDRFIDYLNFGGYPEAVLNESIRLDPDQFVRNDIIDKVLLKDLPSLYGISDIKELNRLFSFLAYNAGAEASLEGIASRSGITKPTIKKYIEYLESAFLIVKMSTVDENCRTLKRERNFKIYLSNPSMRAALFAPVKREDSEQIGHLAESAIFSQWQHSSQFKQLRYARWKNEGEVDIVYLRPQDERPLWVGEIKWSDRIDRDYGPQTRSMMTLLKNHKTIENAIFTTKTKSGFTEIEGRKVRIVPSALYCYTVGRNITSALSKAALSGS